MSVTISHSLAERAKRMKEQALDGMESLADWERLRSERRREFLRCLGLDAVPGGEPSVVREMGSFAGAGFQARKITFQLLPSCWGAATVFYPDPAPEKPAPAVLYLCGHAGIGVWHYQYWPIAWARRGYVCMIVDTIEQEDNQGEHHGFLVENHDAWLAMGYSAAGGETWNSLCALEVLLSDASVDSERVGVTGISGGGAVGFYVAALDDRIRAVSSVCGISTAVDALVNQRLAGHCDCLYPHNVYGRDLSEYAALLAPRAALFCFGDHDYLYAPEETADFVRRTQKVFALTGHADRCQMITHPCGHVDHPVFVEATQKWFDRFVAGEERPLLPLGVREVSEPTASIFQGSPPKPDHLRLLPELLTARGSVPLPCSGEDWPAIRHAALRGLPPLTVEEPSEFRCAQSWRQEELERSLHGGFIGGVDVWLEVIRRKSGGAVILTMAGGGEFLRHAFGRMAGKGENFSIAAFQPRLSGANFPSLEPPGFPRGTRRGVRQHLMRAMALTGQTPVMMHLFDLQAVFRYLMGQKEFVDCEWYLHGHGETGVAALYLGLTDERVAGVILEDLPASHVDRVPILGILPAFDIPQAVGLMAPRKVGIVNAGHDGWTWPKRVFERLGCPNHLIIEPGLDGALARILGTSGKRNSSPCSCG